MKKVFKLQVENKNPERQLEAVKNEIRKYLKRERKKKLPEDAIYWDFECRFGEEAEKSTSVIVSALIGEVDKAHINKWSSCYVEIIAKASMKKETVSQESEEEV